jgi:SAM-dependent methyltransferase
MKSGTEALNYGRDIVRDWASERIAKAQGNPVTVLDIGLGGGADLLNVKQAAGGNGHFFGIESYAPNVEHARKNGIEVADVNVESAVFPYEDRSFDIVIANQILEHTKELFWIFAEVARILKPEGVFIVGVPNLASLHNRVALLLGMQPTAIKTLGPHVRGFTKEAMREFAEVNGYFSLRRYGGSNFYPFPPAAARKLGRWFPGLAVGNFYLFERTDKAGSFLEVLDREFFETPYFRGPDNNQNEEKQ